MKIWNSLKNNIYIKNIFLVIIIIIALMMCLKWWLNFYTKHGEVVTVPDVKGLQVLQAADFFDRENLRFEVVDSVYDKKYPPGVIVETIPVVGTKVKENRNIYITINAYSARTGIVPEVKDQSLRQAIAKLNAVGFKDVQIKYMPGAYKDLVLGMEYKGRGVNSTERLSLDSKLVLLVSDGALDMDEYNEDSIDTETEATVDESWLF